MSKAGEAVTAHKISLGTKSLDVPEWVVDGVPLRIFWTPLTPGESAEIFKDDPPRPITYVRAIMLKARDEAGKKLFEPVDREELERADAYVVMRIAAKLLDAPSKEEMEKN